MLVFQICWVEEQKHALASNEENVSSFEPALDLQSQNLCVESGASLQVCNIERGFYEAADLRRNGQDEETETCPIATTIAVEGRTLSHRYCHQVHGNAAKRIPSHPS